MVEPAVDRMHAKGKRPYMRPGHLTITEWRVVILKEDWRRVQVLGSKPEIGPLD